MAELVENYRSYICSNCGAVFDKPSMDNLREDISYWPYDPNYCPNCGDLFEYEPKKEGEE